jgi:hypothetical protein
LQRGTHAASAIGDNWSILPKPKSRVFFERATPAMNGFHLASGAGPKLEALGAVVTQPLNVHPAETHNKR